MISCVFFDRDGTLGMLDDVRFPQPFTYFPDAFQTVATLKHRGIKVMIVSNQACIARGLDGGYDFAAEFSRLGADDWFICPHDEKDGCSCRKPRTGLLERAFRRYKLKSEECVMVGDRDTDILCGKRMGVKTVLLSSAPVPESFEPKPDCVISTLSELIPLLEKDFRK